MRLQLATEAMMTDDETPRIFKSLAAGLPRSTDPSFIIGAAIGTGMIANAAERGGADFLLALNAGRVRVMGAPSIACMLPIHDANEFVESFAVAEIVGRVSIPVVFGVSAFDPRLDLHALIERIAGHGFSGVANFPTSIHLDPLVQESLARVGLGFQREVELLRIAQRRGLAAVAYVRTADQAALMAELGVDVICLNFGWNSGGRMGLPSPLSLEDAAASATEIFQLVRRRHPKALCVVEGGPIDTPENAASVCASSRADGYIGGSTIDRLPLEAAVAGATSEYKSVNVLSRRLEAIQDAVLGQGRRYGLIGRSPPLRKVVHLIDRFAATDMTILIQGPNGAGKELVAQALHGGSRRSARPMVAVNCAAIPRDLLESELFGYQKGAFTGAVKTHIGRFEQADGGTLFLDEIGDLELQLQGKLLRVLEAGVVDRLGAQQPRRINVRILCATNRDLAQMVAQGTFREDLYYRLNKMEIRVPSLAERIEDIPLLVEHFLQMAVPAVNENVRSVDGPVLRALMAHSWPGNIRELRNVLERAAILCDGDRIRLDQLPGFIEQGRGRPRAEAGASPAPGNAGSEPQSERDWILEALRRHRFRRGATAEALGISRKTLYNKLRQYGVA
jgi:DNA-binding NtrC family response regulator/predicted TIM-barrel enzyme